jgi:hypothetical protein
MDIRDHVGEIGTGSDCHQQKKIQLQYTRAPGKDGQIYSPYLRCEDCVQLELDKDKT